MFEYNRVHNIDVLEGLKQLPDNSVDVIITSPPYNKAGYEGFIRKPHKADSWKNRNISYDGDANNDFMPEDEYEKWQIEILNECWRVLKPDGSLFYNHKVRLAKHKASHPLEWCLKTKLVFRQELIWDRHSTLALAPIRFLPTTELILWFTKERRQPNFKRNIDAVHKTEVLRINPEKDNDHPAPFPKELVDALLVHIDNKEGTAVVLDIFAGSGTTLIAGIERGFKTLGFEKSESYVEMANKRIDTYLFADTECD